MKTTPAPTPALPDLGPEVAVYRGRRLRWPDLFTLFLPGIAAVAAPLFYGGQIYFDAYTHYGPAAAADWSLPWFGLAGAALLVFFILLGYRLALARRRVTVYQNGLAVRGSFGRPLLLPYTRLTGIAVSATQATFLGRPVSARWQARLFPTTGRPVTLDGSLEKLPDLIDRLKAGLYARLLPVLQADFQRGAEVFFGPLAVQAQALRLGSQLIPWSQVSRLEVRNGALQVSLNAPVAGHPSADRRLPVAEIPNLELLFQLIHSLA